MGRDAEREVGVLGGSARRRLRSGAFFDSSEKIIIRIDQ